MREYDDAHGGPRRQSYAIEAMSVSPDLCRYVTMLARPTRAPQAVTDTPAATATATVVEEAAETTEPDIATPSAA
jgi:hypothetical protein